MRKKTETICFRLEETEHKYIKKLCDMTGKTESEILRRLIRESMNGEKELFESQEAFLLKKELINEINHIGVNINQIVKNHNSHYYSDYEKKKLFASMEEVKKLLAQCQK